LLECGKLEEDMKANELTTTAQQDLKSKILKSKNTKFYIDSPISFNRIRISKKEASESVFWNLRSEVIFSDISTGGILIERIQKNN